MSGLLIPLRPWQPIAVDKMLSTKAFANFDTVGIGKTIESLAAIESFPIFKAVLVLESSTMLQWKEEISKFTGRDAYIVQSESKERREAIYNRFNNFTDSNYLIIGYGKTRVDFDLLVKLKFNIILFDEGSILSNPNKTRDYCKWLARHRQQCYILTATPITRDIMQFYDIFDSIGVSPISRDEFLNQFADYQYERVRTRRGTITKINILGAKNMPALKELYASYYIRRKKADIKEFLKEIPKNYYYRLFDMDENQQLLYNRAKDGYLTMYRNDHVISKRLDALTAYTAIVQILDSPYLIDNRKTSISPKIQGLLNLIPELDQEQAVIYTKYVNYGKIVQQALQKAHYTSSYLHGQLSDSTFEIQKKLFIDSKTRFLIVTDIAERGLNLQNANNIIFMDMPFTPDTIFQFIGRLDRIGQESPFINVFFMLMKDTVEYNIFKILKERQKLFDDVFEEDKNTVFNLTTQDFIKSL